jgi:hypothetical protein
MVVVVVELEEEAGVQERRERRPRLQHQRVVVRCREESV